MTATMFPPEYPSHLEQHLTLDDGREIFVRPIVPGDTVLMRRAVEEADEDTLYYRFFTRRPNLDEVKLAYLAGVDYVWRLALIAFGPHGPVAIARYEGTPEGEEAEFAVVVEPGWRRSGVATLLGELLKEVAAKQGIKRFVAFYLADNPPAERMLERLGFGPGRLDSGVMTAYCKLS